MRTIAIVNQKGGCGKTTTAINLAATLARRGQRMLLVDMDPQSHCAAGLGVPESRVERGVGDVLLGDLDRPIDGETFLWEVSRNLHLAPSTLSLAALEAAQGGLSGLIDRDRRLVRMLGWLAPRFDVAIVDCPPTIGLLTFNALRAADEVLVPVETGFLSFRGAEKQIGTIRKVVERLGRPLPFRLVATLYRDSRPVDHDILAALQERYGDALVPVVIRDHDVLREATRFGQAVTEYAPTSAAASDFEMLAEWLERHPSESIHEPRVAQPTWQPHHLADFGSGQRQPSCPATAVAPPRAGGNGTVHAQPVPCVSECDPHAPAAVEPATSRAAELVRRVRDLGARAAREAAGAAPMVGRAVGGIPVEKSALDSTADRPIAPAPDTPPNGEVDGSDRRYRLTPDGGASRERARGEGTRVDGAHGAGGAA